jgi:TPP-dependent 2-oxoacid decarboxylase
MPSTKVTIGNYLLQRLKSIGVDIIFGVPGDYNLVNDLPFLYLFLSKFEFFCSSHSLIKLKVKFQNKIIFINNSFLLRFHLDFEGIQWGNNCNELNASYAADGYARIQGIAVS